LCDHYLLLPCARPLRFWPASRPLPEAQVFCRPETFRRSKKAGDAFENRNITIRRPAHDPRQRHGIGTGTEKLQRNRRFDDLE